MEQKNVVELKILFCLGEVDLTVFKQADDALLDQTAEFILALQLVFVHILLPDVHAHGLAHEGKRSLLCALEWVGFVISAHKELNIPYVLHQMVGVQMHMPTFKQKLAKLLGQRREESCGLGFDCGYAL